MPTPSYSPPVIAYAPYLQLLSRSRRSFRHPRRHPIIHSFFSSLVLGAWVWRLGSYCFFDSPGAHMGVRQGGFPGDVPIAFPTRTTFQLRLKIALVLDTLFLRFWIHLGCQDDPQNPRKSFKNKLRKCTPTSKPLRSDFYRFVLRFSTPLGKQKTR